MLDLTYIREHTDEVKLAMANLYAEAPIDEILNLDKQRRALLQEVEALKRRRNQVSKEIGTVSRVRPTGGATDEILAAMKYDDDSKRAEEKKLEMRKLGEEIRDTDATVKDIETRLRELMLTVPNIPDPSVPIGKDDTENIVTRIEGEPKTAKEFGFEPKPHWDLGTALGIIDFERGVKVSGTRFYMLIGAGAKLQRALISFMLDVHIGQGYTEVYPPYLVKREVLIGTGQLPKFAENQYYDQIDDLWMIPTAEVPVTNMYADEILDGDKLPINHVAYTACFRREQMSAGRDTRGIKRGHQFDKVEMVKFCTPETSMDELARLIDNAEEIARLLKIPHRIIQMCTGDLSFTAAVKYDIELWAPGCNEWLEVSSCSNFGDFQARRANIKFKRDKSAKAEYLHTLNGSGLALPRVMIAVLENYQQPDGSVVVPEVLRPYMGGLEVIRGI